MRNTRDGRDKVLMAAGAAAVGLVAGIAAAPSRRAASQAVDSMTGDWLDALTAEHLEIVELFDLIEAAKPENPSRRRKLAARLRVAVEKHAFQEETVVYPAARLAGAETAVATLVAHQAEIKFLLYHLDQVDAAEAEWTALAGRLRVAIEHLVAAEAAKIFPLLRETLQPKDEEALTALLYRAGAKLA